MNKIKPTILVVDDESSIRESFSLFLEPDYKVLLAGTGEAALRQASAEKIDLVFLDIRMPGMDGIEALRRLKENSPNLEIVMVTAVYDVQKAAQSIRYGARDYVVKPFDINAILALVKNLIYKKELLRAAGFDGEMGIELVGRGEKIKGVRKQIEEVAKRDSWALIVAEDGSEKEQVAEMVHRQKRGESSGFKIVEAFSASEEEFFGEGLKDAQTVFIDHIEKLAPSFAAKLCTLEKKIRVIGGTSKDLKVSGFSPELYDKLSSDIISLPPLRERAGDLVELLEHYRVYYNELYNTKIGLFSEGAIGILSLYSWPGNITELKSLVSTAVLNQREGELSVESLPLYILMNSPNLRPQPFEDIYSDFEKDFIDAVLKKVDSNQERAASLLGIKPLVLDSKLL